MGFLDDNNVVNAQFMTHSQMKKSVQSLFEQMVLTHQYCLDLINVNPYGLTPQQSQAAFGSEWPDLMQLSVLLIKTVNAAKPGTLVDPTMPPAPPPITPTGNPPSDMSAIAISFDHINLSWTNNSTEVGVRVERSTDQSTWSQIYAGEIPNQTFYDDTGLIANTLYYYRVINAAGTSDTVSQITLSAQ